MVEIPRSSLFDDDDEEEEVRRYISNMLVSSKCWMCSRLEMDSLKEVEMTPSSLPGEFIACHVHELGQCFAKLGLPSEDQFSHCRSTVFMGLP